MPFRAPSMCPTSDRCSSKRPRPTNPIGVKGIGESGSIAAPPCMVHAVLDALSPFGIKHLDMPLTPPRVWAAVQQRTHGSGQ